MIRAAAGLLTLPYFQKDSSAGLPPPIPDPEPAVARDTFDRVDPRILNAGFLAIFYAPLALLTVTIGADVLLCITVGFHLYFLPALITCFVRHDRGPLICTLNFLTGWTGVGWIVTLFWALRPLSKRVR